MNVARFRLNPSLEFLQWFGLFGAALTWTAEHVTGYWLETVQCGKGGENISVHTSQLVLLGISVAFWLLSQGAAVAILMRTMSAEHDGPPPDGRRHFFAIAAVGGNMLFLVGIILDTVGAVFHTACGQA